MERSTSFCSRNHSWLMKFQTQKQGCTEGTSRDRTTSTSNKACHNIQMHRPCMYPAEAYLECRLKVAYGMFVTSHLYVPGTPKIGGRPGRSFRCVLNTKIEHHCGYVDPERLCIPAAVCFLQLALLISVVSGSSGVPPRSIPTFFLLQVLKCG